VGRTLLSDSNGWGFWLTGDSFTPPGLSPLVQTS